MRIATLLLTGVLLVMARLPAADPPAAPPATPPAPAAAGAPSPAPAEAPRTGIFQLTFSERHPESAYTKMEQRLTNLPPNPDAKSYYQITDEPFDVNVPSSYDGTVPYGLMVHIDSGKTGNPYVYKDLLGPHHLIWIGSATSDNDRGVPCRFGLALDAVYNMTRRYHIDPKRIYVCGLSGGGRCASMIGVTYADVFTGGAIYMVGCNQFVLPDEKKLGVALREPATNHRYVFMTGSKDFNHDGTKAVFEFYKSNGFKHITLIDTPGMGHEFPPQAVFSTALDDLDAPLLDEAKDQLALGEALEKRTKLIEAFGAYQSAAHDYPLATEVVAAATPKLEALRQRIDAQLQPELAHLASATTPSAEKVREFAAKWSDFPVAASARSQADTLAGKLLDGIIASAGAVEPGKLEKFLATWHGYPVAERALSTYDGLAATAAAPLDALTEADKRDRAQLKFLAKWSAGPTVEKIRSALEHDLAEDLATITAIDKPALKAQKLTAFSKAWRGTEAATAAQRQLDAMIAAAAAPAPAR